MKQIMVLILAMTSLSLIAASCGRETPIGTLEVTSDPEGLTVNVSPLGEAGKSGTSFTLQTPATRKLPLGRYLIEPVYDDQEYSLTPPQREVEITGAQKTGADFQWARLGRLTVTSTTPGASVWIDGEDTGEVTPVTLVLVEGEYEVSLLLEGYVSDSGPQTYTVAWDAPLTAPFTLLRSGFVAVSSTPAGASIVVDGAETGETTPATLELAAGDHVLKVSRAGFMVSPDSLVVTIPEDDTVDAAFVLVADGTAGDLEVTSLPSGAAITIDGEDTGEVTPHTFSLTPFSHSVNVARDGFHDLAPRNVTVVAGSQVTEDFTLSARKIVLLETMSGVNCPGCPAMNIMLKNLEDDGDYHADRVLGMKISGPFGGPDLHYDANTADMQDRQIFYGNGTNWNYAAPTLFFDGDLAVAPEFLNGFPSYGDMVIQLDAALATDPGFAIEAAVADWSAASLQVTVDLIPTREIDDPNAVLMVAVVENPVLYDTAPGEFDETEFHWITREIEEVSASPLPISPASPGHFEVTVPKDGVWTDVVLDNLWLVAFVQNTTTLEILQAGALEPASTESPSLRSERNRP